MNSSKIMSPYRLISTPKYSSNYLHFLSATPARKTIKKSQEGY